MVDKKELVIRKLVTRWAWPELWLMHSIGGTSLRSLATDIYTGFGMFPGREKELAAHLSRLPMEVINDMPTFIYRKNGQIHPLLIHVPTRAAESIQPTMFVLMSERYVQMGIKDTRTLSWMVSGAERIHRSIGVLQPRESVYAHIVSASKQAAVAKGITP